METIQQSWQTDPNELEAEKASRRDELRAGIASLEEQHAAALEAGNTDEADSLGYDIVTKRDELARLGE